ncbi:hypothetical protein HXX02_12335 [Microbulbifer elongatus]|uniref:Uncharacterized protein n=1 Tax=Microbulbifer elongatus TaxID=86173 RepID=A0ABT1P286_9GAMM|nr:hypothetical protein [Microbulbifer elongatus]MCQ3830235.1 hypothetical protein [Microbulbifer elongatus]
MDKKVALTLLLLPITTLAGDDLLDLHVERTPLLTVWNAVVEKCPDAEVDHRIIHAEEPVTLTVERTSCRDVLQILIDFDKGAGPSK